MKNLQQIRSDFEQILSEVLKISGISVDSAVQISSAILQEFGKYNRCPAGIAENGNNDDSSEEMPATFNQKKAMRNLKISFPEAISKVEAGRMIESAVSKFSSNGRGRVIPARSAFLK